MLRPINMMKTFFLPFRLFSIEWRRIIERKITLRWITVEIYLSFCVQERLLLWQMPQIFVGNHFTQNVRMMAFRLTFHEAFRSKNIQKARALSKINDEDLNSILSIWVTCKLLEQKIRFHVEKIFQSIADNI